ncbi:MAG TPA: hypothetical protein VIP46_20915 [Pyrinomonadaceae bacterium]
MEARRPATVSGTRTAALRVRREVVAENFREELRELYEAVKGAEQR